MKLKNRFKKALYSFFEKEILDTVGHRDVTIITSKDLKFTEIRSEILLNSFNGDHNIPQSYLYENALQECKDKLFEETMKYVHIDSKSVTDSHLYDARAIKLKLYVGHTNENI